MIDQNTIDFAKGDGLVPCIIQDASTRNVLMMGYMNNEALAKTMQQRRITFWSRSKNRLWTKGEESGNYLTLQNIQIDCDGDTLLCMVSPIGPTCHQGTDTCWGEENTANVLFLKKLETIIVDRKNNPNDNSYTSSLFAKGINKVAQKVGEEAIELVIEAKDNDTALFVNEAADLMYHYIVLLAAKDLKLTDVIEVLRKREK